MKIAALVMLADYAVVAQGGGLDYYSLYADDYEYYTDALGNKKKKKKNKNKESNNGNNYQPASSNYQPSSNYAPASSSNWAPSNSWGEPAKGTTWANTNSPLVGNGRFCWNCYARADANGSAYANCFSGAQAGFIEMCTGEEYFCMWNERRHEGRVTEVGGGCKSDHSCLNQMTANFKWEFDSTTAVIAGDQCRAGSAATSTLEDSVCTWCCDGMVTNRFNPSTADLCNYNDKTTSPAGTFVNQGSTDSFQWFSATEQFAGLYADGEYHRLFMIAIQTAIGNGILSG